MKKDFRLSIGLVILIATLTSCKTQESELYARAAQAVKNGQKDFAYMYYNQILRDYPNSPFQEPVLFALAEYYAFLPDYAQANELFHRFIDEYPDSKAKLFALGHLLRIAEMQKNDARVQQLRKDIVTLKQISFVFRDFKEFQYNSPFTGKHKAVFRINEIEFYLEGDLFAKISF